MTELATRDTTPIDIITEDPTGGRLVAWAAAASAANQLARALVATSFVPSSFAQKPGEATAAILLGDELGLSPINALRSIYVVHGSPAMYARTMVALAQSRGHQVWTEATSDQRVIVCGQRLGSEHVERAEWTIDRARKAGYTNNKKYASTPQEMLWAKAAGEVARKIAADVLAGIPYSVEDIELEQDAAPTSTMLQRGSKRTMSRSKTEPVQAPEPELDGPDTGEQASGDDEATSDSVWPEVQQPADGLFPDADEHRITGQAAAI